MKLKSLFLSLLLFASSVSAETISLGLTLKIPDPGQTNWSALFRDDFAEPVSSHDHTGGGKGLQLGASSFSANAVNGSTLRLNNDQYLRARNFANSADLNTIKVNTSNKLIFDLTNVDATTRTSLGLGTISTQDSSSVSISGGAITGITDLAVADGGTGASNASGARTNLGLVIGTNVAAAGANSDITSLTGVTTITTALTSIFGSSASDFTVGIGTSNGTDNRALFLVGAGAVANGRGAHVDLYGYDHGSFPGTAAVTADGGELILYTTESDPIGLYTNGSKKWEVEADGDFANNSTNGGDVIFQKDGTGVDDNVTASATAAGTNLATATAITRRTTYFATVASGTGGAMPATIKVGSTYRIINHGANNLLIYANTGHDIMQYAAGPAPAASITVLPGNGITLIGLTSTRWVYFNPQ